MHMLTCNLVINKAAVLGSRELSIFNISDEIRNNSAERNPELLLVSVFRFPAYIKNVMNYSNVQKMVCCKPISLLMCLLHSQVISW